MSSDFGPPPEPGQFDRPYIAFGHAAASGAQGRTPTIPSSTPHAPEMVPGSTAGPGASPIDAIRIDGQPGQPFPVDRVTVPGAPHPNVFEAAGAAPDVVVQVANLRAAAGSQTRGMVAAPTGVPRSGQAPTFIAPSSIDDAPRGNAS